MTGQRPPPAPPRRAELGLSLSTYKLHNGLRVVLVRDPRAHEVQVTMRYGVGSVDDGNALGIAHMAEHLMFEQVLGSETLFSQVEKLATYFNGITTHDATTYITRAPRTHLDRLLSIEGVRLGLRCTSISESTFAREREVVINELRERDEATQLFNALHAAVFPEGHPYRDAIGGSIESLNALTLRQVCAFVDQHYAPGNAVLVVSGDLTPEDLDRALSKFIARIASRDVAPQSTVPSLLSKGERAEAPAPIDDDALLITWPLPPQPLLRTQMRTVASALPLLIDQRISGTATAIELGDTRAPVFAIVVSPNVDTTLEKVRKETEAAIEQLNVAFKMTRIQELDELTFDRIQQSAIYSLYASLENSTDRDTRLATYVLEGRDPRAALGEEFEGIRKLTPDVSSTIATQYLSLDRANIITLKATGKPRGHEVAIRPEIHDMGQRRSEPDLSDAHRPATIEPYRPPSIVSRQLQNGMRVVLLPTSTVPTVDIRLVFGAGTADDAPNKHGVAEIAARGLDWNFAYLNDLFAFFAAGGENTVHVDADHTRFAVAGVDMHLDYLLAGLRRWVIDGTYDADASEYARTLSRAARDDRNRPSLTAWTRALFGAAHPYALAEPSTTITDADIVSYRREHFTPDNATLVIAGHFDVDLANRWVDYLFADWRGQKLVRATPPKTTPEMSSLAIIDDLQQLQVLIALPASARSRAERLVAAAMLREIAGDIRQKLGASYGVQATLREARLASEYEIAGWVDLARAPEVIQVFAQRLAELRADPKAAARVFIDARARVLVDLTPSTPQEFANEVEHEVSLEKAPLSTLAVAEDVRNLTIDGMAAALTDLDLSRATLFMRGPEEPVRHAFDALGRKPTFLNRHIPGYDLDDDDENRTVRKRKDRDVDLGIALTDQTKLSGWTFMIAPAYVLGNFTSVLRPSDPAASTYISVDCCAGVGVSAELGMYASATNALGLRLGVSTASGKRTVMYQMRDYDVQMTSYDVAAFFRASGYQRLWGELFVGLHVDNVDYANFNASIEPRTTTTKAGLSIGLGGGVDVIKVDRHRIGVFATVMGAMPSGYGAFLVGLAYRR